MSRAPLWPTGAPLGADSAADGRLANASPTAPTAPPAAPGGPLPGRSAPPLPPGSAVALQVKLARMADTLVELAETVRAIAQESLAVRAQEALMCSVNEPATTARLLSVRDVAQRLALSERTVRRLRRQGKLPAGIEAAGVIRWRPQEIERWLA